MPSAPKRLTKWLPRAWASPLPLWGLFALAIDLATLLYCSMILWILIAINRHWDYRDVRLAGHEPGYTLVDVAKDYLPTMVFLLVAWLATLVAAWLLWVKVLCVRYWERPRHERK